MTADSSNGGDVMVQALSVSKAYVVGLNTLRVLKEVSFTVRRGERVAVTGPSGAGKSTLLHILGGLDRPTGGCVTFQGQALYCLSPRNCATLRARQIGFVFQSFHLLPELDVLDNVTLPAWTGRGPYGSRADIMRRGRELLEAVGLTGRTQHTPLELSGGEQQRVALARSLMNNPDLVLADEPTGNLDTVTGEQVLEYLFTLTRQRDQTLMIVTHNPEVAARCDRILRLVDGQLTPA